MNVTGRYWALPMPENVLAHASHTLDVMTAGEIMLAVIASLVVSRSCGLLHQTIACLARWSISPRANTRRMSYARYRDEH